MAQAAGDVLDAATMATMTLERAGHAAGAWRREARALLTLSLPIVLTNIGQVAIQTTDVVLIGWLGPAALAASVLGRQPHFRPAAVRDRRGDRDRADDRAGPRPQAPRGARAAADRAPGPVGRPRARAAVVADPLAYRGDPASARPGPGADRRGRAVCPCRDVGLRAGALVRRAAQFHRRARAAARRAWW